MSAGAAIFLFIVVYVVGGALTMAFTYSRIESYEPRFERWFRWVPCDPCFAAFLLLSVAWPIWLAASPFMPNLKE